MIKIIVLGTSGSTPTKTRGMPSVALVREGDVYLFDCGEGTQMRMMQYDVNISRIKAIFITHAHGDHIIGIAGLVRTLALNNRVEPLLIFVPKGYEKVLMSLITFDKAMIRYNIDIRGIGSGIIMKGKGFLVKAFRLKHSIPSYGYVFKEDDKRRFIKEKCGKLGIKNEMYSLLEKTGSIKVKGKSVRIEDVTWLQHGKKIVYATDTRPCANTVKASLGADVLIHEATFAENEKKHALLRKHSTAKEAAGVAKKADAKMLVLMHISARYRSPKQLQEEAEAVFKNTVVAKDGYAIALE
ncbi:MAG: ribonuclease Z [Candidatus Micrarchaeia archaeon]